MGDRSASIRREFATAGCALALLVSAPIALAQNSPSPAPHSAAKAASALSDSLTRQEFQALAVELAQKVNLFREAWASDPHAEFFGGTTRDYLYWLLRELRTASDSRSLKKKIAELRALPVIDVREFIIGQSDVDVVSKALSIDFARFGVRRLDLIGPERFDPKTPEGKDELAQGFIPTEKIRLGREGFVAWPGMGDGIGEIWNGKLTVHFTEPAVFAATKYAKQNENHPILLALRYLRLVAIDYSNRHGKGYPDEKTLFDLDPASKAPVERVIREASDGSVLTPYLKQPRFVKWLNQTVQKAFLSYTNPTAARVLFDRFGFDRLVSVYGAPIETYYQYLFQRYPEPEKYAKNLRELGVSKTTGLFSDPRAEFPDLYFFHGTKTPAAFRSILFQGTLPSETQKVVAGAGLYGVANNHLKFAETWGGDPNRVVRLEVSPHARILDITQGAGKDLWDSYRARHPKADLDAFAEALGIDIIRYPYSPPAYVVKNSAVLSRPQGHRVRLMPLSKLIEIAQQTRSIEELQALLGSLTLNQLSVDETRAVLTAINLRPRAESMGPADRRRLLESLATLHPKVKQSLFPDLEFLLHDPEVRREAAVWALKSEVPHAEAEKIVTAWLRAPAAPPTLLYELANLPKIPPEILNLLAPRVLKLQAEDLRHKVLSASKLSSEEIEAILAPEIRSTFSDLSNRNDTWESSRLRHWTWLAAACNAHRLGLCEKTALEHLQSPEARRKATGLLILEDLKLTTSRLPLIPPADLQAIMDIDSKTMPGSFQLTDAKQLAFDLYLKHPDAKPSEVHSLLRKFVQTDWTRRLAHTATREYLDRGYLDSDLVEATLAAEIKNWQVGPNRPKSDTPKTLEKFFATPGLDHKIVNLLVAEHPQTQALAYALERVPNLSPDLIDRLAPIVQREIEKDQADKSDLPLPVTEALARRKASRPWLIPLYLELFARKTVRIRKEERRERTSFDFAHTRQALHQALSVVAASGKPIEHAWLKPILNLNPPLHEADAIDSNIFATLFLNARPSSTASVAEALAFASWSHEKFAFLLRESVRLLREGNHDHQVMAFGFIIRHALAKAMPIEKASLRELNTVLRPRLKSDLATRMGLSLQEYWNYKTTSSFHQATRQAMADTLPWLFERFSYPQVTGPLVRYLHHSHSPPQTSVLDHLLRIARTPQVADQERFEAVQVAVGEYRGERATFEAALEESKKPLPSEVARAWLSHLPTIVTHLPLSAKDIRDARDAGVALQARAGRDGPLMQATLNSLLNDVQPQAVPGSPKPCLMRQLAERILPFLRR